MKHVSAYDDGEKVVVNESLTLPVNTPLEVVIPAVSPSVIPAVSPSVVPASPLLSFPQF